MVVVGPMVLQRCRVACRVAVTRAVGPGSAQPVPASSFTMSISPGDEDLSQENCPGNCGVLVVASRLTGHERTGAKACRSHLQASAF